MALPVSQPMTDTPVRGCVRELLRALVDYAGLFPPAGLAMPAAVANYDAYLRSEWSWLLGRFVVPVARLAEFEAALEHAADGKRSWRLSALAGTDLIADLGRVREFNERLANLGSRKTAVIDSVETKASTPEDIERLSKAAPPDVCLYFEIPLSSARACIPAVAACGRRAKIRTGGETADKFPSPEDVVEFMRLCVASKVPFKATAGLHHPLRSEHRLTYQPDSPIGTMHGFLNVFLAAAFLRMGMDTKLAVELLQERSAAASAFAEDGVCWRTHRLRQEDLRNTRQSFAMSFGSCSFTEPVDDLKALHIL